MPASTGNAGEANDYNASSIEILEGLEPVRKRPGMYIGGTDQRAIHHLVAEIFDNAMDEAVAGFASKIELTVHSDHSISITDNGRGIPTDPHPKFPEKSALEVIFCTLHAGGKFSGETYQTSGGLHGVGASVVNALSDKLIVQVARDKKLFEQRFSKGHAESNLKLVSDTHTRRGTKITFHPDPEIFGKHKIVPSVLYQFAQSKAYLYSGVQIRWSCEVDDAKTPSKALFHFPGGLAEYLDNSLAEDVAHSPSSFSGNADFFKRFGIVGRVEWAINWVTTREGFVKSFCNTVPTPQGGTHENGFWTAILKSLRGYGELCGNKKANLISREDINIGACALISCFIREPEFVGQTKDRLATAEAHRLVEQSIKDHFDNWLAADPKSAGAILDLLILRAEERLQRKQAKETDRKTATKRLRLPGKLVDCSATSRAGTELFIVEGDSAGGSAKMGRNRKNQALLPLRGKILNVLGAASSKLSSNSEINDLKQALGVGLGAKFNIDDLRYEKIIIMTDADVDGAHIAALLMTFFFVQMRPLIDKGHLYLACPPLYRLTQGAQRAYVPDEQSKDELLRTGLGGKGRIDVQRFKGLGEMDAKDLKETTMDPGSRTLIQITIDEDVYGETNTLVDQLMGKKPELRFQYIQENAKFIEQLDV